jgi:hypothetical protein
MNKKSHIGSRPTLGGIIVQHIIVFLICIVFPGLVTFFAPVSWVTFECNHEVVNCTTRTCVFFVVPYKVQRVDHVVEISERERTGGPKRERKHGRDTGKIIHVDGEGFLQIKGVDNQFAEVSVSPASLESVVKNAEDFVKSKREGTITLFTIANWKFGGLMGGILTSFTALYVVGYTLGAIKLLIGVPAKLIRGSKVTA